jgi:hypothetical protein
MSRRRRDPFADTINFILGAINQHPALAHRLIHSKIMTKEDDTKMREYSNQVFGLLSGEFASLGKPILLDLITQRNGEGTYLANSVIANCR